MWSYCWLHPLPATVIYRKWTTDPKLHIHLLPFLLLRQKRSPRISPILGQHLDKTPVNSKTTALYWWYQVVPTSLSVWWERNRQEVDENERKYWEKTRASFLSLPTNTQMHGLHKSAQTPGPFYSTEVHTSTSGTTQFHGHWLPCSVTITNLESSDCDKVI